MPINKFGRYLNENQQTSSPFGDKFEHETIECGGKRLQHVQRGVYKEDCINKEQLDEQIILCLGKIKDNVKKVGGLRMRIDKLEKRFTSPLPPPSVVGLPSATAAAAAAHPTTSPPSSAPVLIASTSPLPIPSAPHSSGKATKHIKPTLIPAKPY